MIATFTPSPLTNCPDCGYSLEGLPGPHRCPECGFEYEANMIEFPTGRRGNLKRTPIAPAVFMLGLFAMKYFPNSLPKFSFILYLLLLVGLSFVASLWAANRPGPGRVFVVDDGVLIILEDGKRKRERIGWADFTSIRWRLIDGSVIFESKSGADVRRLSHDYFRTQRVARAFVHYIRSRKSAAETSDTMAR